VCLKLQNVHVKLQITLTEPIYTWSSAPLPPQSKGMGLMRLRTGASWSQEVFYGDTGVYSREDETDNQFV